MRVMRRASSIFGCFVGWVVVVGLLVGLVVGLVRFSWGCEWFSWGCEVVFAVVS
jgi:hypothetical protein